MSDRINESTKLTVFGFEEFLKTIPEKYAGREWSEDDKMFYEVIEAKPSLAISQLACVCEKGFSDELLENARKINVDNLTNYCGVDTANYGDPFILYMVDKLREYIQKK